MCLFIYDLFMFTYIQLSWNSTPKCPKRSDLRLFCGDPKMIQIDLAILSPVIPRQH